MKRTLNTRIVDIRSNYCTEGYYREHRIFSSPGAGDPDFVGNSITTAQSNGREVLAKLAEVYPLLQRPLTFWHSTKDQFRGRQFFYGRGSWDGSGGTVSNGEPWGKAYEAWLAGPLLTSWMCGGFVANRPPRGLGTPCSRMCRETAHGGGLADHLDRKLLKMSAEESAGCWVLLAGPHCSVKRLGEPGVGSLPLM